MRLLIALAVLLLSNSLRAADDIVLADFEGADYAGWTTTGDAFGTAPARGMLPGQMSVTGFAGKGLVNSFRGGDKSTGTLTSPDFALSRHYLTFLVGGGGFEGKTCVNLLVDSKVVRTATGPNTKPGGSEALEPHVWDVADLAGKTAKIQIVDDATGGWGHINADQFVLTDRKPPTLVQNARRSLILEKPVLNLPVKTGAAKRRMSIVIENQTVREFEIELADGEPDFWAGLDVSRWEDRRATITVDRLPEDSRGLKAIELSNTRRGAEKDYQEPLRPQFHFTARVGWLNDPNGLVYVDGQYHLFFQHNPYGWAWGNMHWGHAVSKDLVHWTELPIAIYPKQFGDWAFSGSAVVDNRNTGQFKIGKEDGVLVAAYTSTGRGECIVYSNDGGRWWDEFGGNPVVKHQGRDPRLFWHEPTKRWVMAVYDEFEKGKYIAFYTSADFRSWEFASRIEGFYECPDIFELPVDGDAKQSKWVLTAASSEYMIGAFDGRTFKPETAKLPGHRGNAFYAAQTFNNEPKGRRVQIGWGRVTTPGMPFNQQMMFPCELTLKGTAEGPRLAWMPVAEIESLREKSHQLRDVNIKTGAPQPLADLKRDLLDLTIDLEPKTATEIGLRVRGLEIRYDVKGQTLSCGDRTAPVPLADGKVRVRLLIDRTSVEIFAGGGLVYMPMAAVPKNAEPTGIELSASGGDAVARSIEAHELKSAWLATPAK